MTDQEILDELFLEELDARLKRFRATRVVPGDISDDATVVGWLLEDMRVNASDQWE